MKRIRVAGIIFCMVAITLLAACEGDQGPAGPAGPAGPSVIIAFASVHAIASPVAWNFGGAGTDSVVVTRGGVGIYEVRFHGDYADFIGKNDVTVLVTVEEGEQRHVASADFTIGGGSQSDGSEFWTDVLIYDPSNGVAADKDFAVLVLRP